MVSPVRAYTVVHAVTRALYADLLRPTSWQSLVQAPDYPAVLALLAETPYGAYLEIDRALLTPRRSVYQIRQHLSDVYRKLIRLAPDSAGDFLTKQWHHYEVDNVKAALRGNEAGATWEQVLHLLYPMGHNIDVGLDRLRQMVEASDIEHAIAQLSGTLYHEILSHALVRYHAEQSLFPLEVALDLGYRRLMWRAIDGLSGTDREMALATQGNFLDADNLLWAIRYRVYHHLSEEEIVNYTLPTGYVLNDRDIRDIARGEDLTEVVFRVYPQLVPELMGVGLDTGEGLRRLERALVDRTLEACRKAFVGYPFHIGIPLGYLWLSEYEIRDLTVIIEAKASGTPAERYLPMLVLASAA